MARKSQAPTRSDVAKLAGVSETVVSYVINNNRYVAADKRSRVLAAVEQLHYRPNSIARALRGKGSGHFLFIADSIDNEYFGRLVRQIDTFAYDKGYMISMMGVRNSSDFVSRILSRQVDAVVISSSTLEEKYVQQLIDAGLPVVLLMTRDYSALSGPAGRIYTGIEFGIMAGVRLLYESGCRHIVHVDRVSASRHFSTRRDLRYRGFCCQMEVLGLPLTEDSFLARCPDHDALFEAVCRRVREGAPVDGFVCRNDQLACTVLSAVQACQKDVPKEICIIGFDNASLCTLVHPALSTIQLDREQIARAAIDMIDGMIHGEQPSERHLVAQMILRGTTREVPAHVG